MAEQRTGVSPFLKAAKAPSDPTSIVLGALTAEPQTISELAAQTRLPLGELINTVNELNSVGLVKKDQESVNLTPEGLKTAESIGKK